MKALWRIAGILVLLCAASVPSRAIIVTCDDICTCNSLCTMGCKIDGFHQSNCGAIGVCRGGSSC
ncbi:MAG TPA: hypothetical protein VLX28_03525 [Thermoanaerobaculia bacterium]|nr:hypothetical protein [Thermoanaerobaculia bacterium]